MKTLKKTIINYFFEEDEAEIIKYYNIYIKLAIASAIISLLIIL